MELNEKKEFASVEKDVGAEISRTSQGAYGI